MLDIVIIIYDPKLEQPFFYTHLYMPLFLNSHDFNLLVYISMLDIVIIII